MQRGHLPTLEDHHPPGLPLASPVAASVGLADVLLLLADENGGRQEELMVLAVQTGTRIRKATHRWRTKTTLAKRSVALSIPYVFFALFPFVFLMFFVAFKTFLLLQFFLLK
jgi:hypothetical protein